MKKSTIEIASGVAQGVQQAMDGDFSGLATRALSKLMTTSRGLKTGDIAPEEAIEKGPAKSAETVKQRETARAAEAQAEQKQTAPGQEGPRPGGPGR